MGGRNLDAFADSAEGSQAVVQHRYRTVRISRSDGVFDSEDVRRDTRSARRYYRVQREAGARIRRLPRQLSGWSAGGNHREELGTMARIFDPTVLDGKR